MSNNRHSRVFLSPDERGSVLANTNSSGALLYGNGYDEYGNGLPWNQYRFRYTGQAWIEEIGLHYYKARMYSAELGRFMHADPIGYAGGANMYAYVGNDPINGVDPLGLADQPIDVIGSRIPSRGPSVPGSTGAALGGLRDIQGGVVPTGPLQPRHPIAQTGQMSEEEIVVTGQRLTAAQHLLAVTAPPGEQEIVVKGRRLPLVLAAAPGQYTVEYFIPRRAWFKILLFHGSPFADLTGRSKFNDDVNILTLITLALGQPGYHQPNGNIAYVYQHYGPVGTLSSGHLRAMLL